MPPTIYLTAAQIGLGVLIAGAVFVRGVWPFEAAAGALTQLALLALLFAFVLFFLGRPASAAFQIAFAALAIWRTAEAFAPADAPVAAPEMQIVWANLYERPQSLEAAASLALATQADIAAFTEYPDRERLPAGFADAYPYRYPATQARTVVYSRTPFSRTERLLDARRAPLLVETAIGGRKVRIVAVHASVPFTPGLLASQRREIAAAFAAAAGGDAAVVGDFNAAPWNGVLSSAPNDLRRLKLGPRATWLSPFPLIGIPIDHAFVSGDLKGAVSLGPANGSDHLPIVVSLSARSSRS